MHRRRKVKNIGGGGGGGGGGGSRFRIWGGGAKGGANSKQAHDVVTTSITSHRRHFDVMCPLGFNKSEPDNHISHLKI